MISAVNLQRKFILILMFLGGQFSGGKVVSFQAEKTRAEVSIIIHPPIKIFYMQATQYLIRSLYEVLQRKN